MVSLLASDYQIQNIISDVIKYTALGVICSHERVYQWVLKTCFNARFVLAVLEPFAIEHAVPNQLHFFKAQNGSKEAAKQSPQAFLHKFLQSISPHCRSTSTPRGGCTHACYVPMAAQCHDWTQALQRFAGAKWRQLPTTASWLAVEQKKLHEQNRP